MYVLINYLGARDDIGVEVDRLVGAELSAEFQNFVLRRFPIFVMIFWQVKRIDIGIFAPIEIHFNFMNVLSCFAAFTTVLTLAFETVNDTDVLLSEIEAELEQASADSYIPSLGSSEEEDGHSSRR